jgi:transposase-like protein
MLQGGDAAMGRRSRFTPAQKRDAVLAVLTKKKTVSEVCRELQVSETSFNR